LKYCFSVVQQIYFTDWKIPAEEPLQTNARKSQQNHGDQQVTLEEGLTKCSDLQGISLE
jgi:hypothetical protein